jgi:pyrroline-5-carboxylate reductase
MTSRAPLAVIGFGSMGSSIVRGACRSGLVAPGDVIVAEPDEGRRRDAAASGIARVHADASDALADMADRERTGGEGTILLAIKPQMLAELGANVHGRAGERRTISILAGVTAHRVREAMGGGVRVVRVMPNLPASIGQGVAAIARGASPADLAFTRELFLATGPQVMEIDEGLMDAFTALAGSGPAYLFFLAESMVRAGVEMGFTPAEADAAVRQTLLGAASMLAGDPRDPASLRAAVTSRGGTTAAALASMEADGVDDALRRAIKAAEARGRELGRSNG